jgi:RNA polymerase sigma-70 factor (ECF subfamily)
MGRPRLRRGFLSGNSDDFALVLADAQAGEPWALQHLFAQLGPGVVGYFRTQGVRDTDEFANEVFLRAFRRLGDFTGPEAAFRSWVFTIAHHLLVDDRRRTGRAPQLVELGAVAEIHGGDAEADGMHALSEHDVRQLLAHLSPDQRDVIVLRMVADLSIDDVAHTLGKRVGAVKALQRRAIAALRREISGDAVS